jgi:hypothetical protein
MNQSSGVALTERCANRSFGLAREHNNDGGKRGICTQLFLKDAFAKTLR